MYVCACVYVWLSECKCGRVGVCVLVCLCACLCACLCVCFVCFVYGATCLNEYVLALLCVCLCECGRSQFCLCVFFVYVLVRV